MAEWRLARGWSDAELRDRLAALDRLERNFGVEPDHLHADETWRHYRSEARVGVEPPGPPVEDGPFERMVPAVAAYRFSDPDIVEGHFDPDVPLLGRRMLLELKPLFLRYLCGTVVGATRYDSNDERTTFGYRYETLEGHIESGAEWFLLEKDHATGVITFRIDAHWRPGQFPNWWSRLGFSILGQHYQRRWHRAVQRRLAAIGAQPASPRPTTSAGVGGRIEHTDVHIRPDERTPIVEEEGTT